jgi:hypothetical protein
LSNIWTLYLGINTVKYNAAWEIMITYDNLQIVWLQFFSDMLIFIFGPIWISFGLSVFGFD